MALDRRELAPDPVTAFQLGLDGRQATMWTAMPAVVLSFDPAVRTASLQITIQAQVQSQNGKLSWLTFPPLLDCPVKFPGGQGLDLTFPLAPGDEVLVIFSSRCIDNWWKLGGIQTQAELRMHDLSDGFCLPAVLSEPAALQRAPVAMDAAELRNADGTTKIRLLLNGDIESETLGNIKSQSATAQVTADDSITMVAPDIAMTGDVTVTGNVSISGTLIVNGLPFHLHRHTGVMEGEDTSGGPIA